ncbi:MAG: hypothetical protein KDC12_09140 [Flavobacteriales bacterium]|nr:hypothetical protein [Flavobacteriales bacterium]
MKIVRFVCIAFGVCQLGLLHGQELSMQETLDSVLLVFEEQSLYADRVNWDTLKVQLHTAAAGAQTLDDLSPVFNLLLETLEDEHARVMYQFQPLAWYSTGLKPQHTDFDFDELTRIQSEEYGFESGMVVDDIGYIRILGMAPGDEEAKARVIQDSLCSLVENGAERFIVDLRYNTGGTIFPMAEGLSALFEKGTYATAHDLLGENTFDWNFDGGDFYMGGYSIGLQNGCGGVERAPVVVLLSNYTVSSGEALAIMLKSRPNTHFMGNESGGMITVTNFIQLPGDISVVLSTHYLTDRQNTAYRKYVSAEEHFDFVAGQPLSEDPAIEGAVEWLSRQ